MKKQWISMLAFTMIIGLSGCGSDSSTGTSAAAPALPVATISGKTIDMAGVWKGGCYASGVVGSVDWIDTASFTGQTLTVGITAYTSTDLSCTGTASVAGSISADLATAADEVVASWVLNSGAATAAPIKLDGSGAISGTPSFTKVTATITGGTGVFGTGGASPVTVGQTVDISSVVDDTGAKARAYSINYATGGASTAIADDTTDKQ